tara:strand:- start:356 stop:952 length:597 start_codon:yes stop_codon:yes gene_type:complete
MSEEKMPKSKKVKPDRRLTVKGLQPLKTVCVDLPSETMAQCEALVPQSARDNLERQGQTGVRLGVVYTPGNIKALLANIVRGLPQESAAILSGIRKQTYWELKKAHPDLADAVASAQALCEGELLNVVRGGFEKHPKLALDVLERRYASWAQKKDINVSGHVEHQGYTLESFRTLAQSRAARDGLVVDVETVPKKEGV